ncbi:MAG: hypothetical protein HJJLKODD_00055 [Phycisphaerae bacterium]|nr:hypothetical protein [Phycisphaerae bacterium]
MVIVHYKLKAVIDTLDLSVRQAEIIERLVYTASTYHIARELSIAVPTVRAHIRNIFLKCNVNSRSELLSILILRLLESPPELTSQVAYHI